MFEFNEFISTVQEGLGCETIVKIVHKNNGVNLHGISRVRPDSWKEPVIYLDGYYSQYKEGMSIEEIISDIQEVLRTTEVPNFAGLDCTDFEAMKGKVMFKVINREKNMEQLQEKPHIEFLDLAVVFYLFIGSDSAGRMTADISYAMMDTWKTDVPTLLELAMNNTKKLDFIRVVRLQDAIWEIAFAELELLAERREMLQEMEEGFPMLMLTSQSGIYGAAMMLYTEVLKDIADSVEMNLVVIPSSVHEVLMMPDVGYSMEDIKDTKKMVHTINTENVAVEDVLSDNIYLFKRSTGELEIAEVGE